MPLTRSHPASNAHRGRRFQARALAVWTSALVLIAGCAGAGGPDAWLEPRIAPNADPILTLDPNANWTECFNRLAADAPDAIRALCRRPIMETPASPDDLNLLMHLSLVRLLSNPATRPRLSACALETRFDLLYLDLKVRGESLGPIVIVASDRPFAWTALYPAGFDQRRAAEIDLEADRRALRAWFLKYAGSPMMLAGARTLKPKDDELWEALHERRADTWEFGTELHQHALLVAHEGGTQGLPTPRSRSALFTWPTRDYNLSRAACIWLGSRPDWHVQERLINLVAAPAEITAHNARFALHFSPDPRIRDLIERNDRRPLIMEDQPEAVVIRLTAPRARHRAGRT